MAAEGEALSLDTIIYMVVGIYYKYVDNMPVC